MEPTAPGPFPPAQAGAFLICVTLAVMGVATLVGWVAGSAKGGLIVGALLGVPAGIVAVYRRYRRYFA
jgi:F0F1-type ATP synthase assembly protein I